MQGGQRRSDCISLQHDCQDSSGVLQGSVARRWYRTVPLREEAWTVVTGPLAPNLSLQYSPLQTIPTGRKEQLSLSVLPRYKNIKRWYVNTEHSETQNETGLLMRKVRSHFHELTLNLICMIENKVWNFTCWKCIMNNINSSLRGHFLLGKPSKYIFN